MATMGNTSAPGNGYFYDDSGNAQFMSGSMGTMGSAGGYVTDIYVYVNGHGGGANIYMAVWEWDSGAVKVNEWAAAPQGSVSNAGQSWMHVGSLNIWLPYHSGGYGIGFWSPNHVIWTAESSGSTVYQHGVASGPATFSGGGTEGPGALGAYVVYTPLAAPTISGISPSPAPPASSVTITGTSFLQATSVTFGGVSASFTINSDTQITATIPSGVTGAGVTVDVVNPAGTGSTTMTIGQIWTNNGSGVVSIKNIWTNNGSGVVLIKDVWVPNGGGTKAIW